MGKQGSETWKSIGSSHQTLQPGSLVTFSLFFYFTASSYHTGDKTAGWKRLKFVNIPKGWELAPLVVLGYSAF